MVEKSCKSQCRDQNSVGTVSKSAPLRTYPGWPTRGDLKHPTNRDDVQFLGSCRAFASSARLQPPASRRSRLGSSDAAAHPLESRHPPRKWCCKEDPSPAAATSHAPVRESVSCFAESARLQHTAPSLWSHRVIRRHIAAPCSYAQVS